MSSRVEPIVKGEKKLQVSQGEERRVGGLSTVWRIAKFATGGGDYKKEWKALRSPKIQR